MFFNSPQQSPMCSPGGATKNGPLFVHKLHTMIFDPNYQNLISWSKEGNSFMVCNVADFSKDVLPKHFKHNNFSSFVRQLNMYAFIKINKSPRGARTPIEQQVWEFSHPKFHRDHPGRLDDIKRKITDSGTPEQALSISNHSSMNDQVVSQLQTQLSQVLGAVQEMQEQFQEVVRELNDTKRKAAIHQVLMKNVLTFMNQNMNLQPNDFPELAAAIQDPSFADQPMDQQSQIHFPGIQFNQNDPLNVDNIDFSFDSILPNDGRGDTMPTQKSSQQPIQPVLFTNTLNPPSKQGPSPTFYSQPQVLTFQSPSSYYPPGNTILQSPYTPALQSPFTAAMQSPFTPALQSPYTPVLQSPYQEPLQSPYHAPLQSPVGFVPGNSRRTSHLVQNIGDITLNF